MKPTLKLFSRLLHGFVLLLTLLELFLLAYGSWILKDLNPYRWKPEYYWFYVMLPIALTSLIFQAKWLAGERSKLRQGSLDDDIFEVSEKTLMLSSPILFVCHFLNGLGLSLLFAYYLLDLSGYRNSIMDLRLNDFIEIGILALHFLLYWQLYTYWRRRSNKRKTQMA